MKTMIVLAIASIAMTGFSAMAANEGAPDVAGYECTAWAGVVGHGGTTVWGDVASTVEEAKQSAISKCSMSEPQWDNCAINSCWFHNAK